MSNRIWGRVSGWRVVIGTKGIDDSEKDLYNLFSARQCGDFSSDHRMTTLELICLLSAIGSSDLVTQYKWFVKKQASWLILYWPSREDTIVSPQHAPLRQPVSAAV